MSETVIEDVEQFTKYGDITVKDKIASGFSENSYLLIPIFNTNNNTWEICTKITTGIMDSSQRYIFGQPIENRTTPQLAIQNSILKIWLASTTSSWDIANGIESTLTLESNTEYIIKCYFNGNEYKIDVNDTNYITISSSTPIYHNNYPLILGYDNGNSAFNGLIDLTETYINVNNQLYWQPYIQKTYTYTDYEVQVLKGMVSTFGVRANGKYDSLISKRINTVGELTTTLMKDYDGLSYTTDNTGNLKLDFSQTILPWKWGYSYLLNTTKYCMLPINESKTFYTNLYGNVRKCGNPTIDVETGECSNFGRYDFLTVSEKFNPQTADNWEMVYKIKYSTSSSYQRVIGAYNNTSLCSLVIGIDNHKLIVWMSSTGTSYNLMSGTIGTTTLTNGAVYYIKATFDGSQYKFELSQNNTNWSTEITLNSSTKLYNNDSYILLGMSEHSNYLRGSIYLDGCYIKKDGVIWWTPACEKTYTNKIVNYGTDYSSFLIYNLSTGICSNFSKELLKVNSIFKPGNNPWEIGVKFKTPSSFGSSSNLLLGGNNYFITPACEVGSSGKFGFGVSSNGSSWNIGWNNHPTVLSTNTWYYAKIVFTGTIYTSYISIDGENWISGVDTTSSSIQYQAGDTTLQIGNTAYDSSRYYKGEIDLSGFYIKFNNQLVWKPDYQIPETYYGCLYNYTDDGSATTLNCFVDGDSSIILTPDSSYNDKRFLGTVNIPVHTIINQ